ncbi:GGDEF domain-containing protein [Deinococcus metallilatus]|uniref:GGDEF domain-containing protein n=2 Tax=Deinococcus metallilatus TaxID=1211322 RepID=A0AAJ5JYH8_9DEIO|nr:GGDEF domain-containing protein [Deinococcus metallilatus]RXJ11544.1 GGDEF domain-containing protein [Deinococcus metallilatus]TLK20592.1 GGDEF domain-containing protein [Deinococcus metallilatus]GMA16983.1 GGDEF domain-containing protein [Deinococcus metallilatus]
MFFLFACLGTVAALGALWMQAPTFDPVDRVALPGLALMLLGLQLALLRRWLTVHTAVGIAYAFSTLYFLVALVHQFAAFAPRTHMLAESTYWFPVLYAAAFLLYSPRRAAWLAGGTYLLALLLCLYHLIAGPGAGNAQLAGATMQFLLVGAVMIVLEATFCVQRVHLLAARDAAYRDALTGLANRRAAEEHLAALARAGRRFTLVLFDLDHFKAVNDLHGHATGDLVLRGVAQAAQSVLPSGGVAARWGGEEFLLLLPAQPAWQVKAMLDTLRAHLRDQRHGAVTGVTACFGVATAHQGEHPDDVLARADAAMYTVKRQGRNDILLADVRRTHHTALFDPPVLK